MAEFMDKESWIKSRTDNPDKLGKNVWGAMYDRLVNDGKGEMPEGTPKDFMKKMTEEYLVKNGLSCDLNDDMQLESAKLLMQVVRAGEDFQSISGAQKCLDMAAQTSQKIKSRSLEGKLKQCSRNGVVIQTAQMNKAKQRHKGNGGA